MKLSGVIIGLIFLAIGVYTTFEGWRGAAVNGRVSSVVYVGPFLVVMGAFRLLRAMGVFPPSAMFRYVALGIAVLTGMGDRALVKATYPQAIPLDSQANH
jgi:hypothetical protein